MSLLIFLKFSYVFVGSRSTQLPEPEIFSESLYTFYIGQNDFTSNLAAIGIAGVKQYLPQVISQIADTIKVSLSILLFDPFPASTSLTRLTELELEGAIRARRPHISRP